MVGSVNICKKFQFLCMFFSSIAMDVIFNLNFSYNLNHFLFLITVGIQYYISFRCTPKWLIQITFWQLLGGRKLGEDGWKGDGVKQHWLIVTERIAMGMWSTA